MVYVMDHGSVTDSVLVSAGGSIMYDGDINDANIGLFISKRSIYRCEDGVYTTVYTNNNAELYGVSWMNTTTAYVVGIKYGTDGGQFVLRTADGGLTWNEATSTVSGIHPGYLEKVNCVNNETGFIVGSEIVDGIHKSMVLRTADGGLNWTKTLFPTNYGIIKDIIHDGENNILYMLGTVGTIIRSFNMGVSWSVLIITSSSLYNAIPNALSVENGNLWVTTNQGTLYQYKNNVWTRKAILNRAQGIIYWNMSDILYHNGEIITGGPKGVVFIYNVQTRKNAPSTIISRPHLRSVDVTTNVEQGKKMEVFDLYGRKIMILNREDDLSTLQQGQYLIKTDVTTYSYTK